jgi:hypothetical protein
VKVFGQLKTKFIFLRIFLKTTHHHDELKFISHSSVTFITFLGGDNMGTLGKQLPRNGYQVDTGDLENFLCEASEIAKKHKVDIETVIRAKHVLELQRANSIACQNGDYFDEQMGGFGNKLDNLNSAICDIAAAANSRG